MMMMGVAAFRERARENERNGMMMMQMGMGSYAAADSREGRKWDLLWDGFYLVFSSCKNSLTGATSTTSDDEATGTTKKLANLVFLSLSLFPKISMGMKR